MQYQEPTSQDRTRGHLKVLGILFILFGFMGLSGLGVLAFKPLFLSVMTEASGASEIPPENMALIESMLEVITWAVILLSAVHVFFNALVGVCLMVHKCYVPCFIAAVLTCMAFPLGTPLGVFTILVMTRPEAKALFCRPVQAP